MCDHRLRQLASYWSEICLKYNTSTILNGQLSVVQCYENHTDWEISNDIILAPYWLDNCLWENPSMKIYDLGAFKRIAIGFLLQLTPVFTELYFLFVSPKRPRMPDSDKFSLVLDNFKKEVFEIISEGFSDLYSVRHENFSAQSCGHDKLNVSPRLEEQPQRVQDLSKKVSHRK